MDIRPVSQLSAPKDVKLADELSGRPATLKRVLLGQEYLYSDMASLELDASVLDEIAPLMAQMAVERGASGTSDERAIHQAKLKTLLKSAVKSTKSLAERRLLERDFEHANPAALRCLKLSLELYGASSLELIPAYLLLAEACMGLERTAQADEFISMAELALQPAEADPLVYGKVQNHAPVEPPRDMLARLHMLKGKVCYSRGDLSGALRSFAKNVYYTSLSVGNPEHYSCGPGLYQLGRTFAAEGRWEQALSCYDKCVDVWYKSLLGIQGSMARQTRALVEEEAKQQGKAIPHADDDGVKSGRVSSTTGLPRLGTVVADEAVEMLTDIEGTRVARLGPGHVSVAEVQYTRALVLAAKKDVGNALRILEGAAASLLAQLGPDHPTTQDAQSYLAMFSQLQQQRLAASQAL